MHPQIIRKLENIELIRELANTKTTEEISKTLNLSKSYIRLLCKQYGIKQIRVKLKPINNIEHEVIIGSILGDGYISINGKWKNSNLRIKHSYKQKEYVYYKYELLKRICPSEPKYRIRLEKRDNFKNKEDKSYEITTMNNPVLNKYRDQWYTKEGKKILNKEEFKNITPLSLAIWFMDDGTSERSGISIATMCFNKDEVLFMSKILKEKFDINTTVRVNNTLYIKANSVYKFINLINRYLINSMKYKIVSFKFGEFRGTPEVDNPDPSSMNDNKVIEKEQRLIGEESTNNLNTSAEQLKITNGNKNYWINYEEWGALRKFYGYKVDDIV